MTEKEKLKEIIKTGLGFHDYYQVVVTEKNIDRLVDKLIENGYGNVKTTPTDRTNILTSQGCVYCGNRKHIQAFIDKVGEQNFIKYVLGIGLPKYFLEV